VVGTNSIIGGGFRLIREQPLSVAIWAVVLALLMAASTALLLPQLAGTGLFGADGFDADKFQEQGMALFGAFMGSTFLFSLLHWFVSAVLLCAAFRAALRPGEGGPASISIGMDELRIFGLMILLTIGAAFAVMVMVLVVLLIVMALGFVLRDLPAIPVLLGIVLWIGGLCAFVYAMIRLALAYPITFIRGRLGIDEAWALTRGNFWSLFAAFLIIFLIGLALQMIVSLPVTLHQIGGFMAAMGDPERLKGLQAEQLRYQVEMPLAARLFTIVAGGAAQAIGLALWGGSLAAAARELLAGRGERIDGKMEND
jgi:hypothetical protein